MSTSALFERGDIYFICCCFVGNLTLGFPPFLYGVNALVEAHSDGSISAVDSDNLCRMLDEAAVRFKFGSRATKNEELAKRIEKASEIIRSMYN